MTFAQILEYMENCPKNEVEKYYFDYCVVKDDDPNVDHLLLCDLNYVIFFKKAITISEDIKITTRVKCPRCGADLSLQFRLSDIEFNKLDEQTLNGLRVEFHGEYCDVSMPTVERFLSIFSKYRMYKKVTDLRLIKLISLFEGTDPYLQKYETYVLNSTHKDITVLCMLEDIYFDVIKPMNLTCGNCFNSYEPTLEEQQLDPDELDQIRLKHGGITVSIDQLAVNFFRDVLENNRLTDQEVLFREVHSGSQS